MTTTYYVILFILYILILCLEINERNDEEITTKDAWEALLWPLLFVGICTRLLIFGFNNIIVFISALFGFNYKK